MIFLDAVNVEPAYKRSRIEEDFDGEDFVMETIKEKVQQSKVKATIDDFRRRQKIAMFVQAFYCNVQSKTDPSKQMRLYRGVSLHNCYLVSDWLRSTLNKPVKGLPPEVSYYDFIFIFCNIVFLHFR